MKIYNSYGSWRIKYKMRFTASEELRRFCTFLQIHHHFWKKRVFKDVCSTVKMALGCKIQEGIFARLINKRDILCMRKHSLQTFTYIGDLAVSSIIMDVNTSGCSLRARAWNQKVRFTILRGLINFRRVYCPLKVSFSLSVFSLSLSPFFL